MCSANWTNTNSIFSRMLRAKIGWALLSVSGEGDVQKLQATNSGWSEIPYIRLFTRHVLSANSSLKSCIKSTWVNFSRNPSESLKIYFICKIVSNLRDWIFHDFDILANIAENCCTRKKLIYGSHISFDSVGLFLLFFLKHYHFRSLKIFLFSFTAILDNW